DRLNRLNQFMASGASYHFRPLLPGLDFDARPTSEKASPGGTRALQDHRPRTPEPASDALRGAPTEEGPPPSPGPLFDRPQGEARCLEERARPNEAGGLADPGRERSPGDGQRGGADPSGSRFADPLDLSGASFPRRSHSLHPPAHPPRLGTARGRPSSTQPLLPFGRPSDPDRPPRQAPQAPADSRDGIVSRA